MDAWAVLVEDVVWEILRHLDPLALLLYGMTCRAGHAQVRKWFIRNTGNWLRIWTALDRYGTAHLLDWALTQWPGRPREHQSTINALSRRNFDTAMWLVRRGYPRTMFQSFCAAHDFEAMTWCYEQAGYPLYARDVPRYDAVMCAWFHGKWIWARDQDRDKLARQPPPLTCMWHRFGTQEAALAFLLASPAAAGAIAIALDKERGGGRKLFVVTTPVLAYAACFGLVHHLTADDTYEGARLGPYQYEILRDDQPQRLYYDGDLVVALNPGCDAERAKEALHYFAQCAYDDLTPAGRPPGVTELRFAVETAHDAALKYSFHGKALAACGVVAGRDDQRAFWAHAMTLALEALQSPDAALRQRALDLRVVTPRRPEGDWLWDDSVYSHRRYMRMLGAAKRPKAGARPRYLVPEGMPPQQRDTITFDQFDAARILNVGGERPFLLAIPAWWHDEAAALWGEPPRWAAVATPFQPRD
jgi:hypothetical protein